MDCMERGCVVEDTFKRHRWWRRVDWNRVLLYCGVLFFIYDLSYCVIFYFYVKALNSSPEFRLVVFKTTGKFMKLYYTLHYYLGDPSLHEGDIIRWHQMGEL